MTVHRSEAILPNFNALDYCQIGWFRLGKIWQIKMYNLRELRVLKMWISNFKSLIVFISQKMEANTWEKYLQYNRMLKYNAMAHIIFYSLEHYSKIDVLIRSHTHSCTSSNYVAKYCWVLLCIFLDCVPGMIKYFDVQTVYHKWTMQK